MSRKGRVFLIIWASFMTLIALGLVGFEAFRLIGKSSLSTKSATTAPMMAQSEYYAASTESFRNPAGSRTGVRYDGKVYDYNEDIHYLSCHGNR
ncbi:hypothetical protein [Butyrivibrio sp. FCS014]|uniref:hypothetical protein n=1 Tax=Butyrivibrio sp. FCS014 TaxID=1408304 RepID=UPI0004676B69|nr:hypothetical protein [Butyrivibrio sp. FCS014]